jgi:hypothetical protein
LGQWRKQKSIRPDLAALLANAAAEYPQYLSIMRDDMTPDEKRKATILAGNYQNIVGRLLPWICG